MNVRNRCGIVRGFSVGHRVYYENMNLVAWHYNRHVMLLCAVAVINFRARIVRHPRSTVRMREDHRRHHRRTCSGNPVPRSLHAAPPTEGFHFRYRRPIPFTRYDGGGSGSGRGWTAIVTRITVCVRALSGRGRAHLQYNDFAVSDTVTR